MAYWQGLFLGSAMNCVARTDCGYLTIGSTSLDRSSNSLARAKWIDSGLTKNQALIELFFISISIKTYFEL